MRTFILIGFLSVLAGCTDAEFDSFTACGDAARIKCFSGGNTVFSDTSTGKVMLLEGGNGWHYRSVDGTYKRILADCVVTVD